MKSKVLYNGEWLIIQGDEFHYLFSNPFCFGIVTGKLFSLFKDISHGVGLLGLGDGVDLLGLGALGLGGGTFLFAAAIAFLYSALLFRVS